LSLWHQLIKFGKRNGFLVPEVKKKEKSQQIYFRCKFSYILINKTVKTRDKPIKLFINLKNCKITIPLVISFHLSPSDPLPASLQFVHHIPVKIYSIKLSTLNKLEIFLKD